MFRETGRHLIKNRILSAAKIGVVSLVLAASLTVSACGFAGGEENFGGIGLAGTEGSKNFMEKEAVLEYTVPTMIPAILVDRNGYSRNEVMYAIIYAEEIPDEYQIRDAETGEVVYIGKPEDLKFDEKIQKNTARLPLNDISKDGSYYVYAEGVGSSYAFTADSTFYQDIYWELVSEECEKVKDPETSLWEVYTLLYSYERYKEVLYSERRAAPDVLDAVKTRIGTIDFESLTGADKYVAIALLAKFGYNYKETDQTLATECIQKASALYKEHMKETDAAEARKASFLALAELYRTSATGSYAKEITSMRDYLDGLADLHDSRYILYGSMGYMTTRHQVNRELCDMLMEKLLYKCRDINDNRNLMDLNGATYADYDILLGYAQQFAAMNYILDGYEYNEQILNIVHYMSGRNASAFVFDFKNDRTSDAIAIYAWLAWLENNGKLDPAAPVVWNYSW